MRHPYSVRPTNQDSLPSSKRPFLSATLIMAVVSGLSDAVRAKNYISGFAVSVRCSRDLERSCTQHTDTHSVKNNYGARLGAETVVGVSIIIEMFPADVRGRWAGLIASAITAGLPASALTGWLLIPAFGWRAMFVVGGSGALLAWLLRRGFPESPRWLEAQGRLAEAEALVVEMERSSFETGISMLQAGRSSLVYAPSVDDGARPSRISSLIVGCVSHVVVNMTVYGFIVWIPTFFVSQGVTLTNSIGITFAMALGGPIGTAMGAVCADAFGRKKSIIGAALCAIFLSIAFAASSNPTIMTVVGFLLTVPIYLLVGIVFAIYTPELFPTEFRLRGVGISSGAGRFASILVPLAVAPLFLRFGLAGVLCAMCVGLLAMTAVVAWLGHEPKRQRSLASNLRKTA